MASLERQILNAVQTRLALARASLGWKTLLVEPVEPVGEDQMHAIALSSGGMLEPEGLTGHVQMDTLEFSVGLIVLESASASARDLLDAGMVAVIDRLINPADIQLGGLVVDIRRGAVSPPFIGRGAQSARIVGVREIGFFVNFWSREGDASAVGP